jgi:hypothetical protein
MEFEIGKIYRFKFFYDDLPKEVLLLIRVLEDYPVPSSCLPSNYVTQGDILAVTPGEPPTFGWTWITNNFVESEEIDIKDLPLVHN